MNIEIASLLLEMTLNQFLIFEVCAFTLFQVKPRILHIVSSLFLISTLLFVQIGVNFFHHNHDVHVNKKITAPLKAGQAAVQKHDEHCKVCSIDFFNHVFVTNAVYFEGQLFFTSYEEHFSFVVKHAIVSFTQGRAPPTLL